MADTLVLCFLLMTTVHSAFSIRLIYSLDEHRPAGTLLGNIADDAQLRDLVSDEDFARLRYSFLTQGNPHTSNFTIDSITGNLTTAKELDREALCSFLEICKLSFEAVAQSSLGSFFQKILLDIYVNDINDNAPEFPVSTYSLEISEGANTGSNYPLASAMDKDTGENNSVKSYDLQPKNSPFVLISTVGITGDISISLELVQRLDREATDFYQLLVLAKDGGVPRRTGTLTLHISVSDINDNPPVFDSTTHSRNISETTPTNSVILTLTARDADIGPNGNITYHFMPRQPESILSLFNLDLMSGELKTAQSLEYEAGKTHRFVVEARDQGVPSKTAQALVDITVIDTVNDPPEIHINVLHPSGIAHVSEYAELGRVVAHIGVEDPDTGTNGDVQCSLSNSSFELRELDKNEFKVILVKLLDRETVAMMNVSVYCRDGGFPPQAVEDSFLVKVVDENDNPPVFASNTYTATIAENNNIGASLVTVSATDADIGSNAEISYRVHPDHHIILDINNNGILIASVPFDREETPEIVAKVLAVDHGNPALTATTTIIITILDVNDNPPVFTNSTFILSVPEEAPKYTVVGQVNATDRDLNENAIIMYQLHHTTDFDFPFIVYADGVIKTNRWLDRETKRSYEFTVIAADLGSPPLNSTARVVVTVTDINDHAPDITFPNSSNNTVLMPHNLSPESDVAVVTATDKDEHHNARIMFYVEGGNGSSFFHINPTSGIIRLKEELHSGHVGLVYNLMIVAQDHGTPQRATQSELFIEIILGNVTRTFSNQGSINIITAMVLVGVTLLLAVIVVATICLLRSSDKKKRLYHAKAEEEKVISSMRRQGSSISSSSKNSTTPLAEKDSEKKEKEVSFSLDEENNVSLSSGSVGYNVRNNDCLFTIPEDSEQGNKNHKSKQQKFSTFKDENDKSHTHIRFHDDSGSDLSGDVSISDSGRGGSDVELQSHGGSSNVLESDASFNGHPRPVRHQTDHQSASPVASFSTFYGSDPHGTSYDNSSLTDSVQSKQFHDIHGHNGAIPYRSKPSNPAVASHRLSVPPKSRNHVHHNQGVPQRNNNNYNYNSHGHMPQSGGKQNFSSPDGGTYVHLKHPPVEGEYMDMNGHKMSRATYFDETASEMNTSAWDNDTTTSGSYTVDPDELCDEIDRLFFKENIIKDVIV